MACGLGAALLSSGCALLGDPPPAPDVAPIEVVAKPNACLLNRDSVAAGTHDTAVIVEQGVGRVRLLQDDRVVLDRPGGAGSTAVTLSAGAYVVECVVDGARSTATLAVTT